MRPEAEAIALAERLLALTYALADAAKRADASETQALFAERAKALAELETVPASAELLDILRKVQAAEVEAQGKFHQGKADAVRDMEKGLHGKKVPGAYARPGAAQSMDWSR